MAGNTIVLDACLAITFGNAEALNVVAQLEKHQVAIARRAASEVTRPPAVHQLQRFVGDGSIKIAGIDVGEPAEQEAWVRFDSSPRFRGRGDAEVLALAGTRGWIVGSDEVAVQRIAEREFGRARVAGSLDFLRWGVAERRLKLEQAIRLLEALDVGPGLLRRIAAAGTTLESVLGLGK